MNPAKVARATLNPTDKQTPSLLYGDERMFARLVKEIPKLTTGPFPPAKFPGGPRLPSTTLYVTTTLLNGETSRFTDTFGTVVQDVDRRGIFTFTEKDWQDGFNLKFFAHVHLCRSTWPLLKAAGGSVVFISGIGARAPVADYMIGASVIGASLAFMRALADLGKRDGVQVNAVNPGSVDTDRFRQRLAIIMKKTGLDEAAAIEHHRKELDITRFGLPGDVAALVRFIVSPQGRWLHGSAVDIDGGQVIPLRMSMYD